MAARFKIIVLNAPVDEPNAFNIAMWADVPAARQAFYANPIATSAWKDAVAGDITALQNGSVVERVRKISRSQGGNLAQMQADAIAAQAAFQAEITSTNLWSRYGSTYDGTTWVAGGVA